MSRPLPSALPSALAAALPTAGPAGADPLLARNLPPSGTPAARILPDGQGTVAWLRDLPGIRRARLQRGCDGSRPALSHPDSAARFERALATLDAGQGEAMATVARCALIARICRWPDLPRVQRSGGLGQ